MTKKIVLAYSGGLDTSIIAKWLETELGYEVITFTADIGQGEELEPAQKKAKKMGIKEIFIENLVDEFASDYIFPMLRANALYEGEYKLGTSIARPLIAKHLVKVAEQTGACAISHGATGKGNDQVRFELNAYALNPDIEIVAPWRIWDLNSREKLMEYAREHDIEIDQKHKNNTAAPYSMDANLLHVSYEGGELENPAVAPNENMWLMTKSLENAKDKAEIIEIEYKNGDAIALNGEKLASAQLIAKLNKIAGEHGVGRDDIVENRFVGIKSRGCYETPAGTVLLKTHRAIESITLDKEQAHLKDSIMSKYAELIYNGFWFAPERVMLQKLIDESQKNVVGKVKVKLYKGNIVILSRESAKSLFNEKISSFEDDGGAYNQKDAEGFIKINSLRLRHFARINSL